MNNCFFHQTALNSTIETGVRAREILPSLKGNRCGENGKWVFLPEKGQRVARLGVIVLQVNDCVDCRAAFLVWANHFAEEKNLF